MMNLGRVKEGNRPMKMALLGLALVFFLFLIIPTISAQIYEQNFESNMGNWTAWNSSMSCDRNSTNPINGSYSLWVENLADTLNKATCYTNITPQTSNFTLSYNWSLSQGGTDGWEFSTSSNYPSNRDANNFSFLLQCRVGNWQYLTHPSAYVNTGIACALNQNFSMNFVFGNFNATEYSVSFKINGVTAGTNTLIGYEQLNVTSLMFGTLSPVNASLVDNICACPGTWNTTCCFAAATSGISYTATTTANNSVIYNLTTMNITVGINVTDLPAATNSTIHLYNSTKELYNASSASINFTTIFSGLSNQVYYFNATSTNTTSQYNASTRTVTIYGMNLSILTPVGGENVTRYLNITYLNGSTVSNVTNYTIYLLNTDLSINSTINATASSQGFYWDTYVANYSARMYYLNVTITDNYSNNMSVLSSGFNITANARLNVTAYDYDTNASIAAFNVTITDTTNNFSIFNSTAANWMIFDVQKSQIYNVTINAAGYAQNNMTVTTNTSKNQTLNSSMFVTNSVMLTIIDEITSNPVVDNITIGLTSEVIFYNYTTNTSSKFMSSIAAASYDMSLIGMLYSQRNYFITVTNTSKTNVTARMLLNNATSNISVYVKNTQNQNIGDSLITIQRLYNTTWYSILSQYTDINGYTLIHVQDNTYYRVTIDADDYNTNQFTFKFYQANSPYTFQLSTNTTSSFEDAFNYVNYSYSPMNTTLRNDSINFSFNCYSATGILDWVSINSSFNNSNATGTPAGMTPSIVANLTNYSDYTYPVLFCFKAVGFSQYCFTVNYYISGVTPLNNSLTNALDSAKRDILGGGSGKAWLGIIAMFIILASCVLINQLGQNTAITTMVGFIGLIVFGVMGWLNIIMIGFICIVGGIMFFYNRTGGGGY